MVLLSEDSCANMPPDEPHVLDNPVWHSLNGFHSRFAAGTPLAKRYPAEVSRAVAIVDNTGAAVSDLAQVVPAGETVALLRAQLPSELPDWTIQHAFEVVQMTCERVVPDPEPALPILTLSKPDVPEMLSLIELTAPGPFESRTVEMGHYVGFRQQGRLVAMAGERFAAGGYREISAVCTHPDYQGKGYARRLVSYLVNANFQRGNIPFLHVRAENTGARTLYETLNFRERRSLGVLIFHH